MHILGTIGRCSAAAYFMGADSHVVCKLLQCDPPEKCLWSPGTPGSLAGFIRLLKNIVQKYGYHSKIEYIPSHLFCCGAFNYPIIIFFHLSITGAPKLPPLNPPPLHRQQPPPLRS